MKLFEYQAKKVFKKYDIPIPKGELIQPDTFEENPDIIKKHILKEIGAPCAIKAQVLSGSRGKAGLIKIAQHENDILSAIDQITRAGTQTNVKLLFEEAVDIKEELYLAITIDPASAKGIVMGSREGGIDIEAQAVSKPEAILKERFDITKGLMDYQIRNIVYSMNLADQAAKQMIKIIRAMHAIFRDYDAELVEINPLFIDKQERMIAGDAKLIIDDAAVFRQHEFPLTRDYFSSDTEYEAALEGIPYLEFDGDISLMCAGAGLTTTVYDLVNYEGGSIANYLEFGGPNYTKAVKAMELCLKNPAKVILVVTFGTIARADVMAQGLVDAIKQLKPDIPIVTCIRGTNEEEAESILTSAGLDPIYDTEEAVKKAVQLCRN